MTDLIDRVEDEYGSDPGPTAEEMPPGAGTAEPTVISASSTKIPVIGPQGFRLSDLLIVLAGGDVKTVREQGAGRGWFVGLGLSLIFAAFIGSLGAVSATDYWLSALSEAEPQTGSPGGLPHDLTLLIAGIVYFIIILGMDRWLVSDQKAGFGSSKSKYTVLAWFGNFLAEVLKLAPRAAFAVFTSLLFAELLSMHVFDTAIQAQLTADQLSSSSDFNKKIEDDVKTVIDQKRGEIKDLTDQITGIETSDNTRTANIAATNQSISDLKNSGGAFYYCLDTRGRTVFCPTAQLLSLQSELDRLNSTAPDNSAKIQDLRAQIARINTYITQDPPKNQDGSVPATAWSDTKAKYQALAPKETRGLLERKRALSELTDPSSNNYNAGVAEMYNILRALLFIFEILPVTQKFIRSITPRTAYASYVAAVEDARATLHDLIRQRAAVEHQIVLDRYKTESEIASNHLATEQEILLRADQRERTKYRLWDAIRRNRRANVPDPGASSSPLANTPPPGRARSIFETMQTVSTNSRRRRESSATNVEDDASLFE